jgi:hypothetical protein
MKSSFATELRGVFLQLLRSSGDTLISRMANEGQFSVLEIRALGWPDSVQLPRERFRLFVAADTTQTTTEQIAAFTQAALQMGMVYCCAWGPGCERFSRYC